MTARDRAEGLTILILTLAILAAAWIVSGASTFPAS